MARAAIARWLACISVLACIGCSNSRDPLGKSGGDLDKLESRLRQDPDPGRHLQLCLESAQLCERLFGVPTCGNLDFFCPELLDVLRDGGGPDAAPAAGG